MSVREIDDALSLNNEFFKSTDKFDSFVVAN